MAQERALQWSPEQISGWLKQQFPTDRDMRISHEAICRGLLFRRTGAEEDLTASVAGNGCDEAQARGRQALPATSERKDVPTLNWRRVTTWPASDSVTWKTDFAMSRPVVVDVYMDSSTE